MGYNIQVRPFAALEIFEAFDWYESQSLGLGIYFLNYLDQFYTTLLKNPFTYKFYEEPVREGKIKKFPYLVVYEVIENNIIIYSVFMAKQNPTKKRQF